jgi:hypothetical protein
MTDILKIIQQRQSTRVRYDPNRPVAKEDLEQIIEAGRWAPPSLCEELAQKTCMVSVGVGWAQPPLLRVQASSTCSSSQGECPTHP